MPTGSGSGSGSAAVERCARAVADWEPRVQAWTQLDLAGAAQAAARSDAAAPGPLTGVTLGVKDMFDTEDLPTEYGCRLFAGHRPRADAATVALLRAAGAVVLGKTVTAELACLHPGPTRNPHRLTHTPGGSSMGSAAAVATGMADVALGTQTAGSVIRPASYCGVWGFKPSWGAAPVAGLKLVAPSLDTVGWFARDPALLDVVRRVLGGGPQVAPGVPPSGFALVRTPEWDLASADSRGAVEALAVVLRERGVPVDEETGIARTAGEVGVLAGVVAAHKTVQAVETVRSLAWEHRQPAGLSDELRAVLDEAATIGPAAYEAALGRRARALAELPALFRGADVLIAPAATGEAPAGLGGTGDPLFARCWTLLGLPTVTVPGAIGATGLPIGVQLVGRPGADAQLLAVARWLAPNPVPTVAARP